MEAVDRNQLLSHDEFDTLGIAEEHARFRIGAHTFGYVRDVFDSERLSVGVGSDVTFYSKPAVLDGIYCNNPISYRFFVRVRPGKMRPEGHDHAHATAAGAAEDTRR